MRDYAKVAPTIWTGETGRKLKEAGRDAQVVAFYLMTCPHSNMIGLYYLPLPVLAHETGMDIEGASKALRRVEETGFACFEGGLEHVFVPEMAAWQIGEPLDPKDNRVKGIIKDWQAMRKSRFYKDFYARYRESYHLPKPSPLQAPSKPLRSQEQEQEIEQEKEQEQEIQEGALESSNNSTAVARRPIVRTRPQMLPIPAQIDTPEFREQWEIWTGWFLEMQPSTPQRTFEQQLIHLARWGPTKAVLSMRSSITNGWKSLRDPDERPGSQGGTGTRNQAGATPRVGRGQKFVPDEV